MGSNEGRILVNVLESILSGVCTLLVYLFFRQLCYSHCLHFNTNICTVLLLTCSVPDVTWLFSTHQCIQKGKCCQRRIKMEDGENVVLVSGICRALCPDFVYLFVFFIFSCAGDDTKY